MNGDGIQALKRTFTAVAEKPPEKRRFSRLIFEWRPSFSRRPSVSSI